MKSQPCRISGFRPHSDMERGAGGGDGLWPTDSALLPGCRRQLVPLLPPRHFRAADGPAIAARRSLNDPRRNLVGRPPSIFRGPAEGRFTRRDNRGHRLRLTFCEITRAISIHEWVSGYGSISLRCRAIGQDVITSDIAILFNCTIELLY